MAEHKTSTRDQWLGGPGDLKEEVVEDVPQSGLSVRVRALPARYSAAVQSQLKLESGRRGEQVARIDVEEMEILQFLHGVIDPKFSDQDVRTIFEKYGPAARKVVAKIDELSGIDKEAIEQTEQRFPSGGNSENGSDVGVGAPAGSD